MHAQPDTHVKLPLPKRALIGMVHVGAVPGTPYAQRTIRELAAAAADEARTLARAGFDAIIIENMHDRPYVGPPHAPAVTAALTRATLEARAAAPDIPCGVQVLSFGHAEALAVALAAEAHFIRVENFVFSHVADEGLLPDAAAGTLLRLRRNLGAGQIALMCDIKKKHASHALTADLSIADAARGAGFFGADGLIVSGAHTGQATSTDDVAEAKIASNLPVWVGSGATPGQLNALFAHADAVIVGTYIKHGGVWSNPVDPARAAEMVGQRGARK